MQTDLERIVMGRDPRPSAPPAGVVVEAVVHGTGPDGLTFTVPGWDEGAYVFGPAPYPTYQVNAAGPTFGDRCLVQFVGEGIANPWVIGWWPSA